MSVLRSTKRPGRTRRRLAVLAALSLLAFCIQLVLAAPAGAAPYTGGFSPTIVSGMADLNGNGVVNGRDDANAFYGDTHIIDGKLDCDAWGPQANDGSAGDGAITTADDCALVGFDGTPNGVTIDVEDGVFQVANGPLPTVFNAADPDNPDVGASDFAWSAINGRVDSNGDEAITGDDCHFGLIGETNDAGAGTDMTDGADILGNPGANECGFVPPGPNTADNGLVDLNSDADITAADSCANNCFFGFDVQAGVVQAQACPGFEGDPRNQVVGTSGPDVLVGTAGADIICGRGGNDVLVGRGGNDILLGGGGADVLRGGGGTDSLRGGGSADTLRGGGGADTLRGNRGNDRLFGGRGNDRLLGGRGSDRLDGGRGRNDRCFGGPGTDTLVRCEHGQA
jgi:Ca2+-binding RTX toxin-like protein